MPNPAINTGKTPRVSTELTQRDSVNNTPIERVVYPQRYEQSIVVQPGMMVVLTAYMVSCAPILVYKLLLSSGVPDTVQGSSCCMPIRTGESSEIIHRVVIPALSINADNPVRVITIPGVYMVAPQDDPDGEITVTATEYPIFPAGPSFPEIISTCVGEDSGDD